MKLFAKVRLWPGERVWVEVDRQDGEGIYHGVLANDPVNSTVAHGSSVSFSVDQVCDVMFGGVQ